MALADLLLRMEGRATDTPDTPCNPSEVTAKPLQDKACTLDTPDTSQIINAEDWALFNAWLSAALGEPAEERRTCHQCQHLRGRACAIAKPGGLVSANRGYQPNPEVLQRCAGYLPNDSDTDQRSSSERWPGLVEIKGAK